jgi:hypothetical protein
VWDDAEKARIDMTTTTAPLTGGCLCGAIRYTVSAPIAGLRACHCTHCQKTSGTGSSVNAFVPGAAFTITQGTPRRYADKADSGRTLFRYFCGDCGSPLYSHRETSPDRLVVRAGSFDNPPAVNITAHIWTRSARPWSHIDPATEQFPASPD